MSETDRQQDARASITESDGINAESERPTQDTPPRKRRRVRTPLPANSSEQQRNDPNDDLSSSVLTSKSLNETFALDSGNRSEDFDEKPTAAAHRRSQSDYKTADTAYDYDDRPPTKRFRSDSGSREIPAQYSTSDRRRSRSSSQPTTERDHGGDRRLSEKTDSTRRQSTESRRSVGSDYGSSAPYQRSADRERGYHYTSKSYYREREMYGSAARQRQSGYRTSLGQSDRDRDRDNDGYGYGYYGDGRDRDRSGRDYRSDRDYDRYTGGGSGTQRQSADGRRDRSTERDRETYQQHGRTANHQTDTTGETPDSTTSRSQAMRPPERSPLARTTSGKSGAAEQVTTEADTTPDSTRVDASTTESTPSTHTKPPSTAPTAQQTDTTSTRSFASLVASRVNPNRITLHLLNRGLISQNLLGTEFYNLLWKANYSYYYQQKLKEPSQTPSVTPGRLLSGGTQSSSATVVDFLHEFSSQLPAHGGSRQQPIATPVKTTPLQSVASALAVGPPSFDCLFADIADAYPRQQSSSS